MSGRLRLLVPLLLCGAALVGCGASPAGPSTKAKAPGPDKPSSDLAPGDVVCAESKDAPSADRIARVTLTGGAIPADLCDVLKVRPGDPFDDQRIDADVRALWADGRVADVIVFREEATRPGLVFAVRLRPAIVSFEIQGLESIKGIEGGLGLERPKVLDLVSLGAAEISARRTLREAGYRRAEVSHEIKEGKDGASVVIRVDAGPRALVNDIRIEGPPPPLVRDFLAAMLTAKGQPLEQDKLERDVLVVQAEGYDRGLIQIDVSAPEIIESKSGDSLDIVLRVKEGPVFKIGKVVFKGDLLGPPKTYERDFWTSKPSAIFSRKVIAADIERIRAFHESRGSVVDISPQTEVDAAKGTVDITIQIDQRR